MLINIIRLAVAVATLALLSSIPAAGQAPKLSPQQLNPPTLNGNKPIAAPTASSTFQRPVTNRDMKPRDYSGPNANGPPGCWREPTQQLVREWECRLCTLPQWEVSRPLWQLLNLTTKGTDLAKARAVAFEYEVIG